MNEDSVSSSHRNRNDHKHYIDDNNHKNYIDDDCHKHYIDDNNQHHYIHRYHGLSQPIITNCPLIPCFISFSHPPRLGYR